MTAHRPRYSKLCSFTSMWPCCFGHHQASFPFYKLGLLSPELAKKLPGSRPMVNTQSQGCTGLLPPATGTGSRHLFLEDSDSPDFLYKNPSGKASTRATGINLNQDTSNITLLQSLAGICKGTWNSGSLSSSMQTHPSFPKHIWIQCPLEPPRLGGQRLCLHSPLFPPVPVQGKHATLAF